MAKKTKTYEIQEISGQKRHWTCWSSKGTDHVLNLLAERIGKKFKLDNFVVSIHDGNDLTVTW